VRAESQFEVAFLLQSSGEETFSDGFTFGPGTGGAEHLVRRPAIAFGDEDRPVIERGGNPGTSGTSPRVSTS